MSTQEEKTSGTATEPRVPEVVHPELHLAWADELLAWQIDRFLLLVAVGERSAATPPVMWEPGNPPARHWYNLELSKPERFLRASAFPMSTAMRSVMVRYAGHPEGVSVPVTSLEVSGEQELLERTKKVPAPPEREVARPPGVSEWGLAPARFIVPFSLRGHLLLVACGENPVPCYEMRWSVRGSTQGSPAYVLQRRRTSEVCIDVISPYMAVESFPLDPMPQAVRVIDANHPEGELLPVRPLEKIRPLREPEAPLAH